MSRSTPTAYQQALEFLYGRINYEQATAPRKGLQLGRMRRLMAALGDPQLAVPVIHVAGTKGKGSVAAMLAAVLQAAGYRTGLHTSPHLERLEERYVVAGQLCSEAELITLVDSLRPVVEEFQQHGDPLTFFELTTAMAFKYFAEQAVEVSVVEVGMGGRLDSTNVCEPCLAVITSISFDHTKQLGDTLEAIATEKAGIIKQGVPVVSGVETPAAKEQIVAVAAQKHCRLIQLGVDFHFRSLPTVVNGSSLAATSFSYTAQPGEPFESLAEIQLGMLGAHQAANAATAIASLAELVRQGWKIDEPAIRQGLLAARCPARIELIGTQPTVVLDAAHNAASATALAQTIGSCFPGRRRRLLFAIAREKQAADVLLPLAPLFEEIVITRFLSNPRAADPQVLAEAARSLPQANWQVSTCDDPHLALDQLLATTDRDSMICIAGSFFLAAELRGTLLAASAARPAALSGDWPIETVGP
jgi:dihydrofolate synthase/folylpolyglutamate synthase